MSSLRGRRLKGKGKEFGKGSFRRERNASGLAP